MDKLLFLPQHRVLAKRIANDVFDKCKDHSYTIAIGGKSGTGKSEVAVLTKDYLPNKHTKILCLDNFYRPKHEEKRKEDITLVGKNEIDWGLLWRSYNNIKNARIYDIIIIEGLYALYWEEFDIGYYISQSYEDSYAFRKTRCKENPDCNFRQQVLNLEAIYVRNSKERADMVLTYE